MRHGRQDTSSQKTSEDSGLVLRDKEHGATLPSLSISILPFLRIGFFTNMITQDRKDAWHGTYIWGIYMGICFLRDIRDNHSCSLGGLHICIRGQRYSSLVHPHYTEYRQISPACACRDTPFVPSTKIAFSIENGVHLCRPTLS